LQQIEKTPERYAERRKGIRETKVKVFPYLIRSHHIELWYAGGRNVDKLKYVGNREIPIYYLCDWDYDELDIYKSVKEKIPHIELLTPNGNPKGIVETEHKSLIRG